MPDETNAQVNQELEEIQKYIVEGQKARDVLENTLFQEWFKNSHNVLFDILDSLTLSDSASRQRAVDLIYLFRKFEKVFKESLETGEIAEKRWRQLITDEGEAKKRGLLGRMLSDF